MRIIEHDTYKEILPDEGKVLYDGKDTTTAVATPINADTSKWIEVDKPEEELEEIGGE